MYFGLACLCVFATFWVLRFVFDFDFAGFEMFWCFNYDMLVLVCVWVVVLFCECCCNTGICVLLFLVFSFAFDVCSFGCAVCGFL